MFDDFFKTVRNEDDCDAFGFQSVSECQTAATSLVPPARRSVHPAQECAARRQDFGDFHELLLRERQVTHTGKRINVAHAEILQHRSRISQNRFFINHKAVSALVSQKNIIGNAEVWREREFLIHNPDARAQSIAVLERNAFACNQNLAGIGGIDAARIFMSVDLPAPSSR